ncbi:MAG TPA: hypothetical protein VHQ65_05395 [Thermoanaerobaculia bacterium]|nr:hypothetical protein [Thermoanaerobaculia bacterium]
MTVDDSYGAGGRGTRVMLWAALGIVLLAVLAVLGLHAWGAWKLAELERQAREAAPPAPAPAEPIPEAENGAARILSGAELLSTDRHLLFWRLRHREVARWSEEDFAAARELLLANAGALVRLRGAADLPRASFTDLPGDWATSSSPELLVLCEWAAGLLRLHAWVALAQGEPELAAGSVRALARLAEALYGVPSVRAVTEGARAELEALRALQGLIATGATPDLLREVAAALPDRDPRQAHRRVVAHLLETLRAGAGTRGRGGVRSYATRDLRMAEAVAGSVAAAAAPDDRSLSAVLGELTAAAGGRPEARSESQTLTATRTALAGRRLARLAVALSAQAAATGGYPRTAPEAPGDPVEGGPFAYQLRADGSVRLVYPEAWRAVQSAGGSQDLLDWTLPPPRPAPAQAPGEPADG